MAHTPARAPLAVRLLHVVLVLLVVAAVGLRFYALDRPLWLDEGASWWFAKLPWSALWGWLPTHENHSPLYYSLVRLMEGISDRERWLRLPSLVAGLGAIAVTGFAAREIGVLRARPLAVLYAVALAATAPLALRHSYDARPYALELLGAALLMAGALRALSPASVAAHAVVDRSAAVCLVLGGLLTAWSQYVGMLSVAATYAALGLAALVAVPRGLRKTALLRLTGTGVLTALGCLPVVGAVLHRQGVIKSDFWTGRLTRDGVYSTADILTGPAFLEWGGTLTHLLTLGILAITAAGLVILWRVPARRPAALVLAATLALPFAGLVLASLGPVSLLIPRSLIALEVPLALLTVVVLTALPLTLGALLGVILAGLGLYGALIDATEDPREDWPALLAALDERLTPDTTVVFESEDLLTVASYYHRAPLNARATLRVREGLVSPVPEEFGTKAALLPFTPVAPESLAAALDPVGPVIVVSRAGHGHLAPGALRDALTRSHNEAENVPGGRLLRLHRWVRAPGSATDP